MEKIIVQAIDCYRHDYWKVSLDLLAQLNIFDAISDYSYLGNGSEPLNEDGYAYLEIDSDCSIFDKAMVLISPLRTIYDGLINSIKSAEAKNAKAEAPPGFEYKFIG